MITVHGFGPYFGLPDGSPFVMKTMLMLKWAGLEYRHRESGVAQAPRGKVPYVEDSGVIIPDSTLIRFHIENKYGHDFDTGLTAEQRAIAWSIEKMVEEHLYFALIDIRWRDDANFAAGPAHFFDRLPALFRPLVRRIVRRRMMKTLHLQGTSRYTKAEVERISCRDVDAIAAVLGDKPFLMGEQPCIADASVFGILANLLVPIFETEVRQRIESHQNLVRYVNAMKRDFFDASVTNARKKAA
jgi:glutathione S-transferase